MYTDYNDYSDTHSIIDNYGFDGVRLNYIRLDNHCPKPGRTVFFRTYQSPQRYIGVLVIHNNKRYWQETDRNGEPTSKTFSDSEVKEWAALFNHQ